MESFEKHEFSRCVVEFHCPRYQELPTIELYMDQMVTYVENLMQPLYGADPDPWLTAAMVNNYIKQGLLAHPHKKKYNREHLAYLVLICMSKQVISIPEISRFFAVQKGSYPLPAAYDYFCTELENALNCSFVTRVMPQDTASRDTQESRIVRALAFALAQKIYLSKYLAFAAPPDPKSKPSASDKG